MLSDTSIAKRNADVKNPSMQEGVQYALAANNIDEMIQASTGYVSEGLMHDTMDDIVDFARGDVNIAVGGKNYKADGIVGTKQDPLRFRRKGYKKEMQQTGESSHSPHSRRAASLSDTSVAKRDADVKNQSMQEGVQYALAANNQGGSKTHYDYSKPFAQQVEDWMNGRIPPQDALLIGRTPEVVRKIGLSNMPMTIDQRHIDYAVNGTKADHRMSLVMLAHLPELLENPVAIIESATRANDGVVAIVDATLNGKQAVAPITIQAESRSNNYRIDANHLASAYGKDNAVKLLQNAVQKENANGVGVYYVDKSRASNLLSGKGVQFPSSFKQDGRIHTIFDAGSPVNRKFLNGTISRMTL